MIYEAIQKAYMSTSAEEVDVSFSDVYLFINEGLSNIHEEYMEYAFTNYYGKCISASDPYNVALNESVLSSAINAIKKLISTMSSFIKGLISKISNAFASKEKRLNSFIGLYKPGSDSYKRIIENSNKRVPFTYSGHKWKQSALQDRPYTSTKHMHEAYRSVQASTDFIDHIIKDFLRMISNKEVSSTEVENFNRQMNKDLFPDKKDQSSASEVKKKLRKDSKSDNKDKRRRMFMEPICESPDNVYEISILKGISAKRMIDFISTAPSIYEKIKETYSNIDEMFDKLESTVNANINSLEEFDISDVKDEESRKNIRTIQENLKGTMDLTVVGIREMIQIFAEDSYMIISVLDLIVHEFMTAVVGYTKVSTSKG